MEQICAFMESATDARFKEILHAVRESNDPMVINTAFSQMIRAEGDKILILNPKRELTRDEALLHAAWLVAFADCIE